MSWQCHRCNHYTADGQKHECINDEVDELKTKLTAAEAGIEKLREALEKIKEDAMRCYIAGNEYFDDFDPCKIVDDALTADKEEMK